jgi:hypothetical protein
MRAPRPLHHLDRDPLEQCFEPDMSTSISDLVASTIAEATPSGSIAVVGLRQAPPATRIAWTLVATR